MITTTITPLYSLRIGYQISIQKYPQIPPATPEKSQQLTKELSEEIIKTLKTKKLRYCDGDKPAIQWRWIYSKTNDIHGVFRSGGVFVFMLFDNLNNAITSGAVVEGNRFKIACIFLLVIRFGKNGSWTYPGPGKVPNLRSEVRQWGWIYTCTYRQARPLSSLRAT